MKKTILILIVSLLIVGIGVTAEITKDNAVDWLKGITSDFFSTNEMTSKLELNGTKLEALDKDSVYYSEVQGVIRPFPDYPRIIENLILVNQELVSRVELLEKRVETLEVAKVP